MLSSKIQNARKILKEYFGFDDFRDNQKEVLSSVLNFDKSILVIMPTGGGKSILYTIPALLSQGLTVVVSPLIALMQDQVINLKSKNINAEYISAGRDNFGEVKRNIRNIKLLFVSPERFVNENFFLWLKTLQIDLVALDEAHTFTEYGLTFRVSYRKFFKKLHELKEVKKIGFLALTATASDFIYEDITNEHNFDKIYRFNTFRDNLDIEIKIFETEKEKNDALFADLNEENTTIVYTLSRGNAEKIYYGYAKKFKKLMYYHAKLPFNVKSDILNKFINDEIKIIASTTAFGMGIDKSDVRFVYHYELPVSIEDYSQQIGRAGRDGKLSFVKAYISIEAIEERKKIIYNNKERLKKALTDLKNGIITKDEDIKNIFLLRELITPLSKNLELNILSDLCDYPFLSNLLELLKKEKNIKKISKISGVEDFVITDALDYLKNKGKLEYVLKEYEINPFDFEKELEYLYFNDDIKIKKFEDLIDYINTDECRHVYLARYFKNEIFPCITLCDNCKKNNGE